MKNKSSILLLSAALLLASCNTPSTSSSHQGSMNPISSLPGDSASSTLPSSSIPTRTSLKGEGTEENPYLIEEAIDLNLMAALSEKGSEAITSYFSLTRDIDCAGVKISQIAKANPFSGHFFGNGHSIKNLSVPYSTIRIGTNRVVIAGLFGYLEDAIVTDLSLEAPTLDIDVDANVFMGGSLFADADASALLRIEVKDANLKIATSADDNDLSEVGSLLGGIGGTITNQSASLSLLTSLSFSGTLEGNHPYAVVGGLFGSSVTNGYGSVNINNSFVNATSIKGGVYAGGFLGQADYFTSLTSVYVKSNELKTASTIGYAGGFIGFANQEVFVKDAIVDIANLIGGKGTSGTIKGAAGYVYGQGYEDYFEGIYSEFGADSYNVYALKHTIEGVTQNAIGHFEEVTSLPADALAKTGLSSSFWKEKTGGYPSIAPTATLPSRTFTLDPNGGEPAENYIKSLGGDDFGLSVTANVAEPSREGYYFSNYYYDAEGTAHYRAYVPTFIDTTVYADWTAESMLKGYYEATVSYGDTLLSDAKPGSIEIGENRSFVWNHFDGAQAIGSIDIYGSHFVLRLTSGDTGYDGVVASFEEGAFSFPDAFDYSSYIYNWTRKEVDDNPYQGTWTGTNGLSLTFKENGVVTLNDGGQEFNLSYTVGADGKVNITGSWNWGSMEIEECTVNEKGQIVLTVLQDYEYEMTLTFTSPKAEKDYSSTGIVGDWYSNTHQYRRFNFLKNGTFVIYSIFTGSEDGSGSFSLENSNVHLYALGSFTESDLIYDPTNKVIYGFLGTSDTVEVMTGHRYVATYSGDDVTVYHFDGQDVIFVGGSYSASSTLSGELIEGGEIVITTGGESKTYVVSGTTLTEKAPASGEDGPSGDEEEKTIHGTWSGKVGYSNVTVLINGDLSGKYGDFDVTWTINGNVATTTIGGYIEITATWNESADTLKITYNDGEYDLEGTLTRA